MDSARLVLFGIGRVLPVGNRLPGHAGTCQWIVLTVFTAGRFLEAFKSFI